MLLAVATFVDRLRPKQIDRPTILFPPPEAYGGLRRGVRKSGKRHFRSCAVVTACDNSLSPQVNLPAMGSILCCPEVGQLVVVRKRPFVVREIVPSAAKPAFVGRVTSHLLKLSSVEDDGLGEELEVVWELEPGTSIHEKSTLPEPTTFDDPKRLQAFLDAVRWGARTGYAFEISVARAHKIRRQFYRQLGLPTVTINDL
jgi:hypothetical protein